jgi:hypothetical protein
MGTNFADSRGNVVVSAEYYGRQAALENNRDFFRNGWADPTTPTNAPNFFGLNAYNTTVGNFPSANALGAILSGRPAGTGVYAFGTPGNNTLLRFNPDSTIYNATGNNRGSFGLPVDLYRYSYQNTYDNSRCNTTSVAVCPGGPTPIQTLKFLETEGFVSAPQTRYSFMGAANYEFNDRLTLSTSARFAQSATRTYLASSTGGGGWAASVPYNAAVDSPVVPHGTIVNGAAVDYTNAATVGAILANPTAFANPGFIGTGRPGAQHPVPLQLAILLNSRAPNTLWCLRGAAGCAAANATTDRNLVGTARAGRDSPWQAETYLADSFVGRNNRQHAGGVAGRSRPELRTTLQGLDLRAVLLPGRVLRVQPQQWQSLSGALARAGRGAGLRAELQSAVEPHQQRLADVAGVRLGAGTLHQRLLRPALQG